jgi:NTE family protein
VLKRIGEIKRLRNSTSPFKIIGAASAGAVNGTALATGAHDFHRCTKWLGELWGSLETQNVYRSDLRSLVPKAGRWIRDLGTGALFGGGHAHSLLDASPLYDFLGKHLRCEFIQRNIDRGNLRSLAIAATNYSNGKTFTFVQSDKDVQLWTKSRRVSLACPITVAHICASAAIPIVFQPVRLTTEYGADYYGDGCLRMSAPLSPVIRLGATRILAIGVRSQKAADESLKEKNLVSDKSNQEYDPPPLAQVLGVSLNAIFLDHLDSDVEHLVRLNQIISAGRLTDSVVSGIREPMKIVTPLALSPSVDLGKVAETFEKRLPTPVRYLMAGLGTKQTPSSDLLSYLLFDSDYTKALIDLGYKDAESRIDEIEEFLFGQAPVAQTGS